MTDDIILSGGRFYGRDDTVDLRLADGMVAEIAPTGTLAAASVKSAGSADWIDLDGRFVGPGLWDEHVHFTQWVVGQNRLDLSGTTSAASVLARVRDALRASPIAPGATLTGFGFRDALWSDAPSQRALDEVAGETPVVLVSADLHCGWLSSRAAAAMNLEGYTGDTGIVSETPWLRALHAHDEGALPVSAYVAAADAAARRGVVGITEFENTENVREWPARVAAGVTALRVDASIWPDRLDKAIAEGFRSGDILDPGGLVTVGPLKVIVDGSLNTRTALCWDPYPGLDPHSEHACGVSSVSPAELRDLLARAHGGGITAAVHAIGDRANAEVVDTFEELGISGRIEHAQLIGDADFARFARLGLTASVQPEHAMDDRDVADRLWAGRTDRSYAYASLHRAGVPLRLGSDAPVAPLDPWQAISASTSRSRDGREPWHPEQSLPMDVALQSSARGRREVEVGSVADLVIVERDPFRASGDDVREMPVSGTLLGGRWTWRAM